MDRRAFVAATLGCLAASLVANAQQAGKIHRVGILLPDTRVPPGTPLPEIEALRQGLRGLGYVEGTNIVIDTRSAYGHVERLPDLAAELVRFQSDVILAVGTQATLAAKHATTAIPIVMVYVADPVGSGIVPSLGRPGGNITGLTATAWEWTPKMLELVKDVLPRVSRVAMLADPGNPTHARYWKELTGAAATLGVQLQSRDVGRPDDLDGAFAALSRARVDALVVPAQPFTFVNGKRIVALSAAGRLPTVSNFREFVDTGGLMSYGPSYLDIWRRAPAFVDKLLKGAKPADLPVEQPTKLELVINLKTAKALSLTIPPSVLARADEIIQ